MVDSGARSAQHLDDTLVPELVEALHLASDSLSPASVGAFQRELARTIRLQISSNGVMTALEQAPAVVSPEIASSLAETEIFWRQLSEEFGLLSSLEVAALVGAKTHRSYASDLRKAGKLVAVARTNKLLYPGFQFDGGAVRPVIKDLTEIAARHEKPERELIYWLCTATTYMPNDARPVDFLDDPDLVAAAADQAWGVVW
ncbi:hypothetical protein B0I08_103269 [Glaciihabitans tibetensis]|uniref:Uncharacterized protein n=1 Tax=Glaciihabitans tibetensis TaxID=1266600 RepID=A0A2T0VFT9_9MICO|nr:hypothetical protein [Glaciihabitans tibetensis]PRY69063.1 hypothetical protein B0I08_103269 [Glaciihabitans tibetensis]